MKIQISASRLFAASLLTAVGVLTTGCASHHDGTLTPRVWVAGGGFLQTWQEGSTPTPTAINANINTYQMIFWQPSPPAPFAPVTIFNLQSVLATSKLFWVNGNNVQVMNSTSSGTPEIRTITLPGGSVSGIDTDRSTDGNYVYAAKSNDGTLVVIDALNETIVGTLKLKAGEQPYAIASNQPGGYVITSNKLLYFTASGPNDLKESDTSYTFPDGGQGYGIATDAKNYVVVTDISNNKVYVYHGGSDENLTYIASVTVPGADTVTVVPDGSLAYVTSLYGPGGDQTAGPGAVYAVTLSTDPAGVSAKLAFSTGQCPQAIEVVGTGNYPTHSAAVVVANTCEKTVSRFDGTTATKINVAGTPGSIAVERP